eukprot:scaffold44586_cov48-Phaeocystis_antarctica.AAC.1
MRRRGWGRRGRRRRHGRRDAADGGLKQYEIAREVSKILCEDRLGRVGGDMLQRRRAHLIPEAPREHGDARSLDEHRRVDGRLIQCLARRCVDRLAAVRDEQHDLSRAHAAIVGEELPRRFEAVGDRGPAVRRHLVDSCVDHGRVVRPWHARRRIRHEGHHGEARRVLAEGVLAHQLLGKGLQPAGPLHRAVGLGPSHRAALI